jgi:hypothetical protein
MDFGLKQLATISLVFVALLILSGCDTGGNTETVNSNQPLISEIKKAKTTSLEEIKRKNTDALKLATDTIDAEAGDEYLSYVDRAKQKGFAASIFDALDKAFTVESSVNPGTTSGSGSSSSVNSGTSTNSGSAGEAETKNHYSSAQDGFSIDFPGGWQVAEGTDGDKNTVTAASPVESASDVYLENISVRVEEFVVEQSLDQYTDSIITELNADLTGFSEVERSEVKIGSLTAKKIIYTCKSGSMSFKAATYVFPKGLKGYTINCCAENSKFSAFEKEFNDCAESICLN